MIRNEMNCAGAAVHVVLHGKIQPETDRVVRFLIAISPETAVGCRSHITVVNGYNICGKEVTNISSPLYSPENFIRSAYSEQRKLFTPNGLRLNIRYAICNFVCKLYHT